MDNFNAKDDTKKELESAFTLNPDQPFAKMNEGELLAHLLFQIFALTAAGFTGLKSGVSGAMDSRSDRKIGGAQAEGGITLGSHRSAAENVGERAGSAAAGAIREPAREAASTAATAAGTAVGGPAAGAVAGKAARTVVGEVLEPAMKMTGKALGKRLSHAKDTLTGLVKGNKRAERDATDPNPQSVTPQRDAGLADTPKMRSNPSAPDANQGTTWVPGKPKKR